VSLAVAQASEPALLACGAAVALILIGLAVGVPSLIGWSAGLLATVYVGALIARHAPIDAATPMVAALLLADAELGFWSLQCRGPSEDEPVVHWRRAATIGMEAVLAAVVATICVLAATLTLGGGLAGIAATLALLLVLVGIGGLAWRVRQGSTFRDRGS
jgi:hypothetical protein